MASASNNISISAGNDNEQEMKNETTTTTNGELETKILPEAENPFNLSEVMPKDGKSAVLENGQHGVLLKNDEKKDEKDELNINFHEKVNGEAFGDNLQVENSENVDEEREKCDDAVPASDGNDVKRVDANQVDVSGYVSNELLPAGGIQDKLKTPETDIIDEVAAEVETSSESSTTESAEKLQTTETTTADRAKTTETTTKTKTEGSTDLEHISGPEAQSEKSSTVTNSPLPKTKSAVEPVKTLTEKEDSTGSNTPTKLAMGNSTGGVTPPLSQVNHRHSPRNGSPERSHYSGGCHKFPDEESRAEYMKIKSEVTGEAETSESEGEEEHTHHGSHSSPDSKTKAEYRKIKYDVTGEALTSESEDETPNQQDTLKTNDETGKKEDKEEYTDIFGNGLLKRRILRQGKGRDTRPDRSQIVMIQSAGRLDDGTAVDWNQCLEFLLGEGEVVQAWDVGVALMELNEVCELVTDARYAYGEQGRQGENPIPPNARITYEIELLAVRDGPDMDTMGDKERIKIGEKKKDLGNDLFSRNDFSGAINCYQRAIKYLTPSSDENVQELRLKCWNNLAAAQIKIKAYSAALSSCQQVLDIKPDNVKALFRKGKVLAAQGELMEAVSFVKKASQNEPGNKTIRTELTNLRRQLTSQNQQERDMYERMVGGLSEKDTNTSKHSIFSWSLVFGATVVALGGIVAALYVTRH